MITLAPAAHNRSPPASDDSLLLSGLAEGTAARLRESDIHDSDRNLLTALGLTPARRFRVCKTGSPCIVEVRGVRVGLAERLRVVPIIEPAPDRSAEE